MKGFRNTFRRITKAGVLCLAALTAVCGCAAQADTQAGTGEDAGADTGAAVSAAPYEDFESEPYTVRTILREYTGADPETGAGAYGRYTELQIEGSAPDTFREAVAACNRRAEESVRTRVDRTVSAGLKTGPKTGYPEDGYRFATYGYITAVTRADRTAFSILETEFEQAPGQADSDITYHFHGTACSTENGEMITLADLTGDDEGALAGKLDEALLTKYGIDGLAGTAPSDYAWTADALGIRFYFHSDSVSSEKRRETGDYTARAITVSLPYTVLPGEKALTLSTVPDRYIAMIDRETVYALPHGDFSILLTGREDAVVIRILQADGTADELTIEYADALSDFHIIRAEGGFYLFRERIGYQEGFFYDFARPDGGFGRFAYNTAQYFDSFLREIRLALPYNPACVHMAEVRRSFGESSYDKCSFVPHGHYAFPGGSGTGYKRFRLTDSCLQIDSYNTACRLLEELPAQSTDGEGNVTGEITVPAGSSLIFESVTGEAPRYDDPPKRSHHRDFLYDCRLADGSRIRFVSDTESTVSAPKGYLNRFTEPVSLWEAQSGSGTEAAQADRAFTVMIGGKEYPLIPDYSLHGHSGEQIDFGEDVWWQVEGYPGRYVMTKEDLEDMRDSYFTQEALSHPAEKAELVISEDGQAVLDFFGQIFRGTLPEQRYYRTDAEVFMESETQRRSFLIILREGEPHSEPERIELYSEGEPATNEPSKVPPVSLYLTRVQE